MEKLHQLFALILFSLTLNFCVVLAYFRFDKNLIVVHAKDVLRVKAWISITPDGEKGLFSYETDFLQEVTQTEERYSIFRQMDASDRNISQQFLAFKLDCCKLFGGQDKRENFFLKLMKKSSHKVNVTCPFKKGTKMYSYNETYVDNFFPPIHIEIKVRVHKEFYGLLKGVKKWTKLFTQDLLISIKK